MGIGTYATGSRDLRHAGGLETLAEESRDSHDEISKNDTR